MIEQLTHFAARLGHWGYAIIFVIVMLECQPFFGLLMAGETAVLISGFLAAQGYFELSTLMLVVASAAIIGDSIGYELGRWLGREWLVRYGRWFGAGERHLDYVYSYFARHGGKSVFFSHFMHVLRAMMPFMAGSTRMRYLRFVFYNSLGCVLWAAIFTWLGYVFGESWHVVHRWVGRASGVAIAILLLGLALVYLWRRRARRAREAIDRGHVVDARRTRPVITE